MLLPVTETPSEITRDLDLADGETSSRLLASCDAQIFQGWRGSGGLVADSVLDAAARVTQSAVEVLRAGPKGRILVAGAGTSGRLAHLVCRQFNRLLRAAGRTEAFRALVAGGVQALVRSVEGAEDDRASAVRQLTASLDSAATHCLYVGVSCGLSAPSVAAQLHALLEDPRAHCALIGFNPAEQARDTPIEDWDQTFATILHQALESPRFSLLNPVLGPEALTGSSRLKGGTATKILLEAVFATALEMVGLMPGGESIAASEDVDLTDPLRARLRARIRENEVNVDAVHSHDAAMGKLADLMAATLKRAGSIYYLGRESAGMMGLIDASECPPTFGAQLNDVRGYLRSGWPELLDQETVPPLLGEDLEISHDDFEKHRLPDLERGDLVVALAIEAVGPSAAALLAAAHQHRATTAVLLVHHAEAKAPDLPPGIDHAFLVAIPSLGHHPLHPNLAETALKLFLNAASTGAFVQHGKVFHNQMVDLRLANQKLVLRAKETIRDVVGVPDEEAWSALVRVACRTDSPSAEQLALTPAALAREAAGRSRLVPTAMLLAALGGSIEDVEERLGRDPVVRRVLQSALEGRDG